eukprot:GHUV01053294.1.p1 GENE.GHUV01053294.1~~GHUV01053294.1.p1  ORF type:complete len:139 (+),score=8.09 GHUV01053294.1:220-636(+)
MCSGTSLVLLFPRVRYAQLTKRDNFLLACSNSNAGMPSIANSWHAFNRVPQAMTTAVVFHTSHYVFLDTGPTHLHIANPAHQIQASQGCSSDWILQEQHRINMSKVVSASAARWANMEHEKDAANQRDCRQDSSGASM